MSTNLQESRQEELESIVAGAMENPDLVRAMEVFQIGQHEYARAISSATRVTLSSSNTSNPRGDESADLD